MPVKNVKDIPFEKIEGGTNTSRQILIGPGEAPNFAMRKFRIDPGGQIPPHTNRVEHEQYILNGKARIGIGEKIYDVNKDDIVFIQAGEPHWYKVLGNELFEFLCLVPNKEDQIELSEKS